VTMDPIEAILWAAGLTAIVGVVFVIAEMFY
jgi:hypothetical protein